MFTAILTRLPDFELVEPPIRMRSTFIAGVRKLPIRFTPTMATSRH
jgi:hypothetical protein